jgi:hypothetical protein
MNSYLLDSISFLWKDELLFTCFFEVAFKLAKLQYNIH